MTASTPAATPPRHAPAATLPDRFRRVRAATLAITRPLAVEDFCIQSCEDVSPTKWHLAHTTWFFERFVLKRLHPDYAEFHPRYDFLFNSYYNTVGPMHCRPARGKLSRPTVHEVLDYRRTIDDAVLDLIDRSPAFDPERQAELNNVMVLGLHHEQQHQELMVTDLKHVFSSNPLLPAYHSKPTGSQAPSWVDPPAAPDLAWIDHPGGLHTIGLPADHGGFCFDNETPTHKQWLEPFALATRTVTNAEFLAFIDNGGYERHDLWLSLGWATTQQQGWKHPIYWYRDDVLGESGSGRWMQFTMHGPVPLDPDEPACHLSFFEADAFARWAGHRLPTEAEWEVACRDAFPTNPGAAPDGHFADTLGFHPRAATQSPNHQTTKPPNLLQPFGTVWEWTSSPYVGYPGYAPLPGAFGEYNGKFMCNQYVLRGGSVATPASHIRPTYRNFFDPAARWQFTGVRLARSL
ncbi:MAG: ergothioneine biosynthesis protein EgtB [Planctomycetota bacterium]